MPSSVGKILKRLSSDESIFEHRGGRGPNPNRTSRRVVSRRNSKTAAQGVYHGVTENRAGGLGTWGGGHRREAQGFCIDLG